MINFDLNANEVQDPNWPKSSSFLLVNQEKKILY